jgi:hypothetical protein
LCGLGDGRGIPFLVPFLQSGEKDVRRAAAVALRDLHRKGELTGEQRAALLHSRNLIATHTDHSGPHTDLASHYDKSTFVPSHDCTDSSTAHDDNPRSTSGYGRHKDTRGAHTDVGAGIDF